MEIFVLLSPIGDDNSDLEQYFVFDLITCMGFYSITDDFNVKLKIISYLFTSTGPGPVGDSRLTSDERTR